MSRTDRAQWPYRVSRSTGVSGGSRVLRHRYEDEGDRGPAHRRLIRRVEARLWRRELKKDAP